MLTIERGGGHSIRIFDLALGLDMAHGPVEFCRIHSGFSKSRARHGRSVLAAELVAPRSQPYPPTAPAVLTAPR